MFNFNMRPESPQCERKINLQGCETVLGSFQLGKTPGDDGSEIEVYKALPAGS